MDFMGIAYGGYEQLHTGMTRGGIQMKGFGLVLVIAVVDTYTRGSKDPPYAWSTMVMCSTTGTVGWVWSNWLTPLNTWYAVIHD